LRILLFYKNITIDGGAERLLVEEYLAFKRLGYDVCLVTFEFNSNLAIGEEIKEEDVIILKSKLWLSSVYQFFSLLKRNKGAHCIASSGFVECYFASLFSGANIHTRQHHPTSMDIENTNKYSLLRRAEYQNVLANTLEPSWIEHCRSKFSLRSSLYFTLKDIIESRLAKRANNVFVLSAFAQLEQDLFYSVKSEVIQGALRCTAPKYNLVQSLQENKALKVLSVCRLERQKRVDRSLMAFSKFLKNQPEAKFYIGGRGPEETYLRKLVCDLNIEKSVVFLGFIPDELLLDYFGSADVFINLDWADFNITVYEALSVGTFVLTSNEGDCDEILIAKNYITQVNPHDSEGIVKALELVSQRTLLFDQEEVSRRLEAYTWDNFCRSTLEFLQ
tara:strand:- start:9904 stop:11073 length:1170 start_codon:yes stop_codon:yes gene_type:complete